MRKKIEHNEILPFGFPQGTRPEQVLKKIHSVEGRLAEFISNWTGSMNFIYLHIIWFSAWIIINSGHFTKVNSFIPMFDPYPFGLLTMIVSLEAIFLSTFILVNQNRQALVDAYRELEEEQEEQEEEKEQEELEGEVADIQKDLDDIKNAMTFISQKIGDLEKNPSVGNQDKNPK